MLMFGALDALCFEHLLAWLDHIRIAYAGSAGT